MEFLDALNKWALAFYHVGEFFIGVVLTAIVFQTRQCLKGKLRWTDLLRRMLSR